MPTFQTAKKVAENALRTIGAFPASQSQADASELRIALEWLEMILNMQSGIRPLAGFWDIIDIPLEAGVGDYLLSDYIDDGVQEIFSVSVVSSSGAVSPVDMLFESEAALENLAQTGHTCRAVVTKDADPYLKIYPKPVQLNVDAGEILRVRFQTYHSTIDPTGVADTDINLRPAWYLWITKRLSFEIGSGPVRKLGERELGQLESAADRMENQLLARDGKNTSKGPPVTEPYGGASVTYANKEDLTVSGTSPGGYTRGRR